MGIMGIIGSERVGSVGSVGRVENLGIRGIGKALKAEIDISNLGFFCADNRNTKSRVF